MRYQISILCESLVKMCELHVPVSKCVAVEYRDRNTERQPRSECKIRSVGLVLDYKSCNGSGDKSDG